MSQVFEPIRYPNDVTMDICGPNPGKGVRSESHWEGADQGWHIQLSFCHLPLTAVSPLEPEGAAVDNLSVCWSGTGSYNSNGDPLPPFRIRVDMNSPALRKWIDSVQPTHKGIDEDDLECPFDIEAEWPEEVFFEAGRAHGDWMIAI